ncbi:MAG: dTDP-6-deoxy-L-hexose 3-O-methyltransferase [Lachnospiraceae bacterium]|nr:dTDP-6-deoxy-L-hexose 3-O-methyltransferase [Lachnospiraceae bacterium]
MINQYDETKQFEYENGFYLTSQPYRMGNILSHYELYKKITNLPGEVVELGVFKGSSIVQWATFRELLENEKSRKIIGFDMFGPFPKTPGEVPSDNEFIDKWNSDFEGNFVSKEELLQSMELKGIHNVELVKGNILDTLPEYLEAHPNLKISLLHIDVDVYEPCKKGLELLFERVIPEGVIVLDDYAVIEGETKAVDEFFAGKDVKLQKYPFSHAKPTFIIK